MNSNMNTRYRNKEHGDFIVIPIPSNEAEHVYKAESVFDHSKDSQGGSTPCGQDQDMSPEVVCTVRLAIGFLLVLSKWCAQSRLAIGF